MALEMNTERFNTEMGRLGKTLVGRLFVLFKTSQNYSDGHQALHAPIAKLVKVVREIQHRNEDASLRVQGRHLILGDLRLKPDAASFHTFGFVMDEMARQGIGGICFNESATIDEVGRFVSILKEVEGRGGGDSYTIILERLQQQMVSGVEVEQLVEPVERVKLDLELNRLKDARLKAVLLYQQAGDALAQVMDQAGAGKPLRLRESKRVVQQMIDLLARDESSLLVLALQSDREGGSLHHPANVCILSLVLGRRLGLPKFSLCALGMAALLHDIGGAGMPREVVDPQVALSHEEQQKLETHPLVGVRMLMQLKGLDSLSARIITGVFEHHLLADFSGYPRFPYKRLSLFGRIISIADNYDALTSLGLNGAAPLPHEMAIRYLFSRAGKAYDQPLLKLFIGCVGLYPVGSLLQLDSNELAVVLGNSPDPSCWREPRVKIITDPGGREVVGEVLDLAHPAARRSVRRALPPLQHRLEVGRYFQ